VADHQPDLRAEVIYVLVLFLGLLATIVWLSRQK